MSERTKLGHTRSHHKLGLENAIYCYLSAFHWVRWHLVCDWGIRHQKWRSQLDLNAFESNFLWFVGNQCSFDESLPCQPFDCANFHVHVTFHTASAKDNEMDTESYNSYSSWTLVACQTNNICHERAVHHYCSTYETVSSTEQCWQLADFSVNFQPKT